MVFSEEGRDAATRWWPFGASRCCGKAGLDDFDALNLAEKGLAKECTSDYMRPLARSASLRRFQVTRSFSRLRYHLRSADGDFVMFARVLPELREVHFFLYDPDDENSLYDSERPALKMDFDPAQTDWLLEDCRDTAWRSLASPARQAKAKATAKTEEFSSELVFVKHSKVKVGEGDNYRLEAVLAPCLTGGDSAKQDVEDLERLVTKPAVWNADLQTLVLDFKDRRVVPSSKNFQLVSAARPSEVLCQHGKLSEQVFALDIAAPLSIAQAFAISVSTVYWQ